MYLHRDTHHSASSLSITLSPGLIRAITMLPVAILALLVPARALAQGCTGSPDIYGSPENPGYEQGLSILVSVETDGVNDCTLTLYRDGQSVYEFVYAPTSDYGQDLHVPNGATVSSESAYSFGNEFGTSGSVYWPESPRPDPPGPVRCMIDITSVKSVESLAVGAGFLSSVTLDAPSACAPFNYAIVDEDFNIFEEGKSWSTSFTSKTPLAAGTYYMYVENRDVDTMYAYPADSVNVRYSLQAAPSGCTAVATVNTIRQTGRVIAISGSAPLSAGDAPCTLTLTINGRPTTTTYDSTTDDFSFTVPNTLVSPNAADYAVVNIFGTSNSVSFAPSGSLEPAQCTITITGVESVPASGGGYYALVKGSTQPECGPLDYQVFDEDGFNNYYSGQAAAFGFTTSNALPAGRYGVAVSNPRVDRNIARPAEVKLRFFQLAEPTPAPEPSVCAFLRKVADLQVKRRRLECALDEQLCYTAQGRPQVCLRSLIKLTGSALETSTRILSGAVAVRVPTVQLSHTPT